MALWDYHKKPMWVQNQETVRGTAGGGDLNYCPGWLQQTDVDDWELLVCIHLPDSTHCDLSLESDDDILLEDGGSFLLEVCPND